MTTGAPAAIGIDVGGTKVLGVVVDAEGNVLAEQRQPTPRMPEGIVDALAATAAGLADETGGGAEVPAFWRWSFVIIAAAGALGTVRLLRAARDDPDAGVFARLWWASAVIYAVIAVVGVAPEIARTVGLTPLQAEATMLILLVAIAHAVAWEFMTHERTEEPA